MSDHFTVARADLAFRVDSSDVRGDVNALRRDFHATTKSMSDDMLKVAIATEKRDKALKRYGVTSTQAKQAELAYRRAVQETTAAVRAEEIALSRAQRTKAAFRSSTTAAVGSLGGFRGAAGLATGALIGGTGLLYALRSSVDAAGDLNEQTSRAQQVFGASSKSIERWSRDSVRDLSLTRAEALRAAGDFGTLFTTVGLGPSEVARLSKQLVQLGADLSSFQNTSLEDSLAAIRSGLVGEAEPLRRYGALLSEARVQQEAIRETGKTTAESLSDQEKVLARITLIMRDTVKAQGDLARTSGSYANETRRLNAQLAELRVKAGQALLPALTEGAHGANLFFGTLEKGGITAERTGRLIRGAFIDAVPVIGLAHRNIAAVNAALDVLGSKSAKVDQVTAAAAAFGAQFGLGALTTSPGLRSRPEEGTRGPRPTTTPRKGGDGLTRLQRLQLQSQRAQLTPGLGDDLLAAAAETRYYEALLKTSKLRGDKLFAARSALYDAQAREQAIRDQIAAQRQAAVDKAAQRERAAADKLAAARRKQAAELAAARKRDEDAVRRALTPGSPYANTSGGFAGGRIAGAVAYGSRSSSAATKEDIAGAVREALASMVSIEQRYAPNFQLQGLGKATSHLYELVTETRTTNLMLQAIAGRGRYPASDYGFASALGAAG